MNTDTLGVYIHIPFCVSKCHYCDFLSFPASQELMAAYVEAVRRELETYRGEVRPVQSVFFGGGTPSIMSHELIVSIMETVKRVFVLKEGAEVTIECNPGTVTEASLISYRECGINRLSMGLQSTDDAMLKRLGRIHTYEQFLDSFSMARSAGFENISVDMMLSLPGQSVDACLEGVRKVMALKPTHISAYSLIVEEGTRLCECLENYPPLPSEEEERLMYTETVKLLENGGYHRYEISNFACDGYESVHNSSYWELTDYIGVGLGASSLYKGKRYSNTTDIDEYIAGSVKGVYEREVSEETLKDLMEEFMFLGLRRMCGVSFAEFKRVTGKDILSVYGEVIDKGIEQGLLRTVKTCDDTRLCLTDYGIDISNVIMSEFILD